ncbi:MAG: general secretion pathway protein GspK [Candidatus Rokubacteria bacterium]|nr:general secretion pathway protein GspK [Candidatus Rokubacteria bacterium]MBI3824456.1 general secretion pathway protein GspK [Candidatus Rokubacteria bacterium]
MPGPRARRPPAGERGFALVAVLLVLALLGVIGAEFAYSMRLESASVRALKDGITAGLLAEAGFEQAVREIVADSAYVGLREDGQLTFYGRDQQPRPRLPRDRVPLGPGQFSYRLTDEEARLNVNTSPPDRIDRLLLALGIDKRVRDVIGDSIQDWRDANEEHRLNGAESEDYYLKLPVPYRSANRNLESVRELLQIRGVTAAIFHGAEGKPGLGDLVTVKTSGQMNINTASEPVLHALGLSDAEISEILQARRDTPYPNTGRFGGRGLNASTRTFRVEAQGLIDGRPRARLSAVVQRTIAGGGRGVAVVEWSGPQ